MLTSPYLPSSTMLIYMRRRKLNTMTKLNTLPVESCPELLKELVLSLKFTLSKVEGKEIGIVFPYFQENGSILALQVDITFETNALLRHNHHSPLNDISRLITVFTTHKKRLMSSYSAQKAPLSKGLHLFHEGCEHLRFFNHAHLLAFAEDNGAPSSRRLCQRRRLWLRRAR